MVELYKHGDPMPKDPWIIRQIVKHPKWLGIALLAFAGAVVFTVATSAQLIVNHNKAVLNVKFRECLHREGAKLNTQMLKANWPVDTAKEQSVYEAAPDCCRKLGRVPLFSEVNVICLSPDFVDIQYSRW